MYKGYVSVYECRSSQRTDTLDVLDQELETVMSQLMWMLGTESSGREASVCNCTAISPAAGCLLWIDFYSMSFVLYTIYFDHAFSIPPTPS